METSKTHFQNLSGVVIYNVSSVRILSMKIIQFPLLEIQQQIVERIEFERTLIKSTKKLIQSYEQKTKATIAKLWEE